MLFIKSFIRTRLIVVATLLHSGGEDIFFCGEDNIFVVKMDSTPVEGWQVGEVGRVHFFRGVSGW